METSDWLGTMYNSKIGFGGGCHWCTEAVFMSLAGIEQVEQGWIASKGDHDTFSEAVIVHFDPKQIPLDVLIEIHLRTHNSTSDHSMRKKYRSAVYAFQDIDIIEIEDVLKALQAKFTEPIITKVLPYIAFKSTEEHFKNYYYKNPEKPFCKSFIEPKLQMLLKQYSNYVDIKK